MVGHIHLSINTIVPVEQLEQKDMACQEHSFNDLRRFIHQLATILEWLDKEHLPLSVDITLAAYPQEPPSSIPAAPPESGTAGLLSRREKEVLNLMFDGLTNKEIAHKLFISLETVKSHRKHILEKTGSKNTAAIFKQLKLPGIETLTR